MPVKLLFILFSVGMLTLSANDKTQYRFENTDTVVLLPVDVKVEKKDSEVFCTYIFKSSGTVVLVAYVGMAPGFPSKYGVAAGTQQIQKSAINRIHGRALRWKDNNGKYNEEDLLAIPYGRSIGFLHFGSIRQNKAMNEKAKQIVLSTEVLTPYNDPRSPFERFSARIKRGALSVLGILKTGKKDKDQSLELYDDVQVSLESTGVYPKGK